MTVAPAVVSWPWFDGVLTGLIVLLAWRSLAARALSQAVVLFIAFGMAVALAWARLGAVDVALAEAAIGAGLLGVLLVDSLVAFGRGSKLPRRPATGLATTRFFVFLAAALGPVLVWAAWSMPAGGGLAGAAAAEIERSGVAHPVTAVLLNFRSYDTWLEIGVLLLTLPAVMVATGLSGLRRENAADGSGGLPPDPLVDRLVRLLVPLMVVVAGAVLWLGESRPGGAFQAGVILGAAVILARLAGFPFLESMPEWLWRLLAVLGFGGFLAFGLLALASGRAFLEYLPESAGVTIFLIEAACTLSIGLALASFHALLAASREQAAGHDTSATGETRK